MHCSVPGAARAASTRRRRSTCPSFRHPNRPSRRRTGRPWCRRDYPLVGTGISNKLVEHSVGADAFFKGWFVYATNLPMTLPGAREQIQRAAQSLDLMVVVDTMPAEITGYADVVLPECTYLERYDDLRNKPERTPTLALRMPAFAPSYETKPAWWMAKGIAERLGLGEYFPWQDYQRGARLAASSRSALRWPKWSRSASSVSRARRPVYFAAATAGSRSRPRAARSSSTRSLLADVGQDPLPRYTPPRSTAGGLLSSQLRASAGAHLRAHHQQSAAVRADAGERRLGTSCGSGQTRCRQRRVRAAARILTGCAATVCACG